MPDLDEDDDVLYDWRDDEPWDDDPYDRGWQEPGCMRCSDYRYLCPRSLLYRCVFTPAAIVWLWARRKSARLRDFTGGYWPCPACNDPAWIDRVRWAAAWPRRWWRERTYRRWLARHGVDPSEPPF